MRDWLWLALPVVAFVFIMGAIITDGIHRGEAVARYRVNCVTASGHVYEPDETLFCLSADGRMLEVYP